jgi:hypothetical protein
MSPTTILRILLLLVLLVHQSCPFPRYRAFRYSPRIRLIYRSVLRHRLPRAGTYSKLL